MFKTFIILSRLEGISFLLLLGVAMPLKYAADIPEAVAWMGMAHGVLFTAYVVFLLILWNMLKWPFRVAAVAGAAAILPFGPFWYEKWLLKQDVKMVADED